MSPEIYFDINFNRQRELTGDTWWSMSINDSEVLLWPEHENPCGDALNISDAMRELERLITEHESKFSGDQS
jgi:hypothetical protein